MNAQISGECLLLNATENFLAVPYVFPTVQEANKTIRKLQDFHRERGFYRLQNGMMLPPDQVQYIAVPAVE